jgi:hypothetical protein
MAEFLIVKLSVNSYVICKMIMMMVRPILDITLKTP